MHLNGARASVQSVHLTNPKTEFQLCSYLVKRAGIDEVPNASDRRACGAQTV